jgi:hypothetical protein
MASSAREDSSMTISMPDAALSAVWALRLRRVFALAASQQRAEALSLASPGTAPAAKYATDGLTTEVSTVAVAVVAAAFAAVAEVSVADFEVAAFTAAD